MHDCNDYTLHENCWVHGLPTLPEELATIDRTSLEHAA